MFTKTKQQQENVFRYVVNHIYRSHWGRPSRRHQKPEEKTETVGRRIQWQVLYCEQGHKVPLYPTQVPQSLTLCQRKTQQQPHNGWMLLRHRMEGRFVLLSCVTELPASSKQHATRHSCYSFTNIKYWDEHQKWKENLQWEKRRRLGQGLLIHYSMGILSCRPGQHWQNMIITLLRRILHNSEEQSGLRSLKTAGSSGWDLLFGSRPD